MEPVKFTVYGKYGELLLSGCEYTPLADIRPLRDYTTGETIGLGIHPESIPVPGRAAVHYHYRGTVAYTMSSPAGYADCRYRLHRGETVRCGDWSVTLNAGTDFDRLLYNLETEYRLKCLP